MSPLDAWADLLACPECHGALREGVCACGFCVRIDGGAWSCTPRDVLALCRGDDALLARWREAIVGLEAWRARQPRAPTVAVPTIDWRIAALARDAQLSGAVLDLGGAQGAKRFAMPAAVTRFVSVDPCAASVAPDALPMPWIALRGFGEALPLRDAAVDAVFSTAAMDYFIDPPRCASEMARVLRPGGTLALLVTVHDRAVGAVRERASRMERALAALRSNVVAAVGLRGALALAYDGARAPWREHTRYLCDDDVERFLDGRFEVLSRTRDKGRYSSVLRVVARRTGTAHP
jgi:SAM-dependent methyltransferase